MEVKNPQMNVGITQAFPCTYLPAQEERIIVLIDSEINAPYFYPTLIANGFRRNGDQLYRPHCELCHACQSLRLSVSDFRASKSQKRIIKKNKHLSVQISHVIKTEYYPLYERYVNTIHHDGPMYPATPKQYNDFLDSTWNQARYLEIYDNGKLVAVSVIDQIFSKQTRAWSAFYCFFDPDYRKNSIGKFAILSQLLLAPSHQVEWLYLGYQINDCQKMNYKKEFKPHQLFIDDEWRQQI